MNATFQAGMAQGEEGTQLLGVFKALWKAQSYSCGYHWAELLLSEGGWTLEQLPREWWCSQSCQSSWRVWTTGLLGCLQGQELDQWSLRIPLNSGCSVMLTYQQWRCHRAEGASAPQAPYILFLDSDSHIENVDNFQNRRGCTHTTL